MTRAFRYDATKCNVVTETLNRSGLLVDARTLLENIQAAYSDRDDDANFPPPEYVAALLGAVNRALRAQQHHVTLMSRIWSKIMSLFFKHQDNGNEFRYLVQTQDIAGKDNSPTQLETLYIVTSGLDNTPLRAVVRRSMFHSHKIHFRTAVLALMTGDTETLTHVPFALSHALAAGARRNEMGLRPAARQQTACFRDGSEGLGRMLLEESTGQETEATGFSCV
jgi:hypothetical protein